MKTQSRLSGLLNFLLLMDEAREKCLEAFSGGNPDPVLERYYLEPMLSEVRLCGYTPGTLIRAIDSEGMAGWLRRSPVLPILAEIDPLNHHSPLHDPETCSECLGARWPLPRSEDDPTGDLARLEVLAEMMPSERREFIRSEKNRRSA